MKKTVKTYMLLLAGAASLLFASCSGILDDSSSSENSTTDSVGAIRISLSDTAVARTALPALFGGQTDEDGVLVASDDYSDSMYTWRLEYTQADADENVSWDSSVTWSGSAWSSEASSSWTSYSAMTSATVPLFAHGTYYFRLTATQYLSSDDTTTVTTYRGYSDAVSISASSSHPTVSFAMNLIGYNVAAGSSNAAKGAVELTLSYPSALADSVTCALYTVAEEAVDSLPAATGALSYDNTGLYYYAVATLAEDTSSVFTGSAIPVGSYTAVFSFSKDGVSVGTWSDEVHVVANNTSYDTVEVSSLDDVYSITYVRSVGSTTQVSFSRHSDTITLPVAIDSSGEAVEDAVASGYSFCGWYTSDAYDDDKPVTSIEPSTQRQSISLYGRYVKTVTNPESLTPAFVGTLTSTSTTGATSSTAMVGNTVSVSASSLDSSATYQWYYAESESDVWTAVSGATAAKYVVPGALSGMYLRVSVQNPYVITGSGASLSYHTVDTAPAAVTSSATDAIAAGEIASGSASLQYSGNVVYGNKPAKANLVMGSIVKDIFGNTITDFDADLASYDALYSTTSVSVTFTVTGYGTSSSGASVTIPVKYATPAASVVTLIEDASTSNALSDGQTMFTAVDTTYTYQYAVASSAEGASWSTAVANTPFTASITKLWVRIAGTETATVGSVIASEPVSMTIPSASIAGGSGGSSTTLGTVVLKNGADINSIFTANFKSATAFAYAATGNAPSAAVTISVESTDVSSGDYDDVSEVTVIAWLSSKTLYVYAEGYDGVTNLVPLPADISGMFANMNKLKSVDVSAFDTSAVTNMSCLFQNCTALTSITWGSSFNASSVTDMSYLFDSTAITELDIADLNITVTDDTPALVNMEGMFANSSLTEIDLSGLDTSSVTNMAELFNGATDLASVTFGGSFSTAKVKNMSYMFNLTALSSVDVSLFDTSAVTNMSYMFANMENLTQLDLSSFDVQHVLDVSYMFSEDAALAKIYVATTIDGADVSNWYTLVTQAALDNDTSGSGAYMFSGCESLVGGSGSTYSSTRTSYTYARVDSGSAVGYFTAVETE